MKANQPSNKLKNGLFFFPFFHFFSMENKREAFRKYLDNGGVLDALTRVLVSLYEEPENPEDALEYIKQFLGSPNGVDVESLQKENGELEEQVEALKSRVTELRIQLGLEEPPQQPTEEEAVEEEPQQ